MPVAAIARARAMRAAGLTLFVTVDVMSATVPEAGRKVLTEL
jgi:hypothetical protein